MRMKLTEKRLASSLLMRGREGAGFKVSGKLVRDGVGFSTLPKLTLFRSRNSSTRSPRSLTSASLAAGLRSRS